MSKRAAEVQLTQDNVDEVYDAPDEPGQFEVASEEQLKQRVIRKAKRNRPLGENSSTGASIFAGLKTLQPRTLERSPLGATASNPSESTPPIAINPLGAAAPVKTSPYLVQLKALNESVSEWIRKHVTTNPYVDLTPIFKDYKSHLSAIEAKYKNVSGGEESQESECRASETEETGTEATGTEATEETTEEEPPSSTADSQESTQEESRGETPGKSTDDEDSLMTIRAKLFYKKGDEYCELGIGTLKVQSSGEKGIRVLLRNDTNVGKILLNVRITSDIPVSSKGNNVFVVCVANPPLTKSPDNSPVSYLIRVKTAQMAEKLLSTLKDNAN